MPTGKLLPNYSHERGFGFIKPDDGGPDVYVHAKDLARGEGEQNLRSGVRLNYQLTQSDRGPRATRVRILGPEPAPANGNGQLSEHEAYAELKALFDQHERGLLESLVDWARGHGMVS